MPIDIVIGAAYGDEGKGQTVHTLATPGSVVARFNGGAQSGHTVDDGKTRHIFSHFGAGTLKGAKTFLSKFFVCHPIMFKDEHEELAGEGFSPEVFVSPECYVTTPYDVALNIMLERHRGADKHGSVGVGFGETIERQEYSGGDEVCGFGLPVSSAFTPWKRLKKIRDGWLPLRMAQLGLKMEDHEDFRHLLESDETIERFVHDCDFFRRNVTLCFDDDMWELGEHFIFEGAQGLMLDQNGEDFPHVSRSNTGLKNVISLIGGETKATVHYLTRAYTTRHGAGPLPEELPEKPAEGISDPTNVPNEHQGTLRFSHLNLDTVLKAVGKDVKEHSNKNLTLELDISCLDQMDSTARVFYQGGLKMVSTTLLEEFCSEAFERMVLQSWGYSESEADLILEVVKEEGLEGLEKRCVVREEDMSPEQKVRANYPIDSQGPLKKRIVVLEKRDRQQRKWIDDLQSGMYISCVYCGHRYGPEDEVPSSMAEVLKEHVEQCPEHPMSKLKAENETLQNGLSMRNDEVSGLMGMNEELKAEVERLGKYEKAAKFGHLKLMVESNGRCSFHDDSDEGEAERQRTYAVINENATLFVNNERMKAALYDVANLSNRYGPDSELAKETLANLVDTAENWTDEDEPLPEDEQIKMAHPLETKDHKSYEEALRMVGAKRSKYALVDLVNWLLSRIKSVKTVTPTRAQKLFTKVCGGAHNMPNMSTAEWRRLFDWLRELGIEVKGE